MSCRSLFVFVLLFSPAAWPCGPDFPLEFLSHRDKTLAHLPDGLFDLEATRLVTQSQTLVTQSQTLVTQSQTLVTPSQTLVPVERGEPPDARLGGGPVERALYAKAAKTWRTGSPVLAAKEFEAVLALPAPQRRRFTVLAEFMLGRLASDDAVAAKHYASVRAHAIEGFDDVLGLGVASLGEEARRALWAHDDARAVVLYAEQAGHQSASGTSSLLIVARQLASDPARLEAALHEPLVQRLMSMYLWSRGTEEWWSESPENPKASTVLDALVKLPRVAGAAHLAAALFRAGRFEDADALARREPGALSHWVLAKLAMRNGELVAADAHLADAEKALSPTEDWGFIREQRPMQQLEVERAILALSRNDFDAAMRFAQASCSWQDVAWVAERVVDVDSLKRVVDGLPAVDPCAKPGAGYFVPSNQHRALRSLLARRLMRVNRAREALSYFEAEHRLDAERYINLREGAERTRDHLERAEKLYEAAKLTRAKGMELFGTEVGPDYGWTGGDYEPFNQEWSAAEAAFDAGLTKEERQRVAKSGPAESRRFHYRHEASRLAEQAANEVSARSQAFVALLCTSARFVADSDPERVKALYRRWVKEGPLLPDDMPMVFARECPTPHFVEPPALKSKPFHLRKRWVVLIAAWGLVSGVAVAASLRRRRRHRTA